MNERVIPRLHPISVKQISTPADYFPPNRHLHSRLAVRQLYGHRPSCRKKMSCRFAVQANVPSDLADIRSKRVSLENMSVIGAREPVGEPDCHT